MRRLGIFVLLPLILFVAAIFAARWVGSLRPLPTLSAALFTERNGTVCQTPCILGIHPDQADMFAAMKAHPLLTPLDLNITGNDLDKTESYRSDVVNIAGSEYQKWIGISLKGNFPAASQSILPTPAALQGSLYLGDLVAILGAPNGVFFNRNRGQLWNAELFFVRGSYVVFAVVGSTGNRFQTRVEVLYLTVYMTTQVRFDQDHTSRWRGFTSVDSYLPR